MLDLKIGRHTYHITDKDEFMDNGSYVQLLTQSFETNIWGRPTTTVLSKRALKEIGVFGRIQLNHRYGEVFTLSMKFKVVFIPVFGLEHQFEQLCKTKEEAVLVRNTIANYTLFLHEEKLMEDHSNAGFIYMLDKGGNWVDMDEELDDE